MRAAKGNGRTDRRGESPSQRDVIRRIEELARRVGGPVRLHSVSQLAGIGEEDRRFRQLGAKCLDQPLRPRILSLPGLFPQLAPVGTSGCLRQMLAKSGKGGPRVGHDADGYRVVHADLNRIDIDLHELRGHSQTPPVGKHLGEAAADGEHGIGVLKRSPRRTERAWPRE